MDIWVSCYFLYDDRGDTVVLSRGGGRPSPCKKNQREDCLKFKNQCHFQYDTTKVYQILRLFTIIKLLILIQSF